MRKIILFQLSIFFVFITSLALTCVRTEASVSTSQLALNKLSVFSNGKSANYYFDHKRYVMDYPELAAVYGNNKPSLWNHYKTNGILEGRVAYATNDHVTAKLRIYEIASLIVNDGMTEYQKIQSVHDWIINNTQYDYGNYLANTIPERSYNIEGPVLYKTGVCSGYADTFGYFMQVLGIKCDCVSGIAIPSSGDMGGHAWNRVLLDGNYYYVDCCWDDPVCIDGGNELNYDYFMKSYNEFASDHIQETLYTAY